MDLSAPLDSLTSLEKVERMVALGIDESAPAQLETPIDFPVWNRSWLARALRRVALPGILLPLTRIFARVRARGLDNLARIQPPVIFASTHQSYLDVPAIMEALPSRWRYRIAPAMRKEFFHEHFHGHSVSNSLNYYLSVLFFAAFPLPQREAGALQTMRYMGELAQDGWCILIFPEGTMTDLGEIKPFQPGIGMLASKLDLPVIPVRLVGLEKVLHRTWKMARRGRVGVIFGPPLKLQGNDYPALAKQVEDAVRGLPG